MAKHKPTVRKPSSPQSNIKPTAPTNEDDILLFSFKHLQLEHPKGKFCIREKNSAYFFKLLSRLKDISTLKASVLRGLGGKSLRAHPIDWQETSEKNGFSQLNEQLRSITPYQFQISANEHGRLHGFFIDQVFYVVWLDPDHELYPKA